MKVSLSKPNITNKEIQIIKSNLRSKWLTHGPNNLKFESNFLN